MFRDTIPLYFFCLGVKGQQPLLLLKYACIGHLTTVKPLQYMTLHYYTLLTAANSTVNLTANCTLGDVRLINGTSDLEGRVEVQYI